MSSVSGTPSMTESPRQMTPSQSKMKQSTLSTSARLSAVSALRAAGGRRRRACGVSGGRAIVSGLNWRRCAFTSCARRRCQRARKTRNKANHTAQRRLTLRCGPVGRGARRGHARRRARGAFGAECSAPGLLRELAGQHGLFCGAKCARAASARLLLFGRAGAVCCVLRASRKGV